MKDTNKEFGPASWAIDNKTAIYVLTVILLIAGINPTVFYDLQKYHSNAHQLMVNFHHTYVFNTVKKGLERGILENIFREDINTEILATLRVSQIHWSFECDLIRNGKHSLYDVILETTIHFLFGVSTLSGHVLINKYKTHK